MLSHGCGLLGGGLKRQTRCIALGEVRLATGKASGLTEEVVVLAFIKGIAEPATAIAVDAGIGAACANEMPVVTFVLPFCRAEFGGCDACCHGCHL